MLNSTLWWCQLQYVNATSPFSGLFGVPTWLPLVDFYVLDPDNGDDEYSNGDVLHLNFDMDTNRPACGGGASNASGASGGGKALVDRLFLSLGADYEGEWATRHASITVIDATGASVRSPARDGRPSSRPTCATRAATRSPATTRRRAARRVRSCPSDGRSLHGGRRGERVELHRRRHDGLHLDMATNRAPPSRAHPPPRAASRRWRRRARPVGCAARRRGRQGLRRLALWVLGDAGHRLLGA